MVRKSQEDKRYVALNTHLIFFIVFFLVFLGLSISCAVENEVAMAVMFSIFALLPIFVFFISPLYFVFDDNAVKIVYNFGQEETIEWNCVRSISLMGSWLGGGGGLPHYVFAYPKKEKQIFFVVGEIPKTRKTKKIIKMYYKKNIL